MLELLRRWVVLAQTRHASRQLADDVRHYVETGTPSPRNNAAARPA